MMSSAESYYSCIDFACESQLACRFRPFSEVKRESSENLELTRSGKWIEG